jgi:hypothetical protein
MKTLKDIPFEKYDSIRYCYDFLNNNKTIGDEEAEYNGLWHIHWRGRIDNNKIIFQIKSILATQYVTKIYFWVEDINWTKTSKNYINLEQFKDIVEIKVFDRNIIALAPGPKSVKSWVIQYYEQSQESLAKSQAQVKFSGEMLKTNVISLDRRYKTDMFRWIILSIYGGMYTDADTLMLRDVRDIRINNWSSKWGTSLHAEACILKLEKGSDAYEQMFRNDPTNPQCFLKLKNELPEAFSYKYDNLRITSLPTTFFDISWIIDSNIGTGIPFIKEPSYETTDGFFKQTNEEVTLNEFFKGCFSYHWHNHWDEPELKNSLAGKLNADIDKIIEKKYNIIPNKIFQD